MSWGDCEAKKQIRLQTNGTLIFSSETKYFIVCPDTHSSTAQGFSCLIWKGICIMLRFSVTYAEQDYKQTDEYISHHPHALVHDSAENQDHMA